MRSALLMLIGLMVGCSAPSGPQQGELEAKLIGKWSRMEAGQTHSLSYSSGHDVKAIVTGENDGEVLTITVTGTWQIEGDNLTEKPAKADLSGSQIDKLKKEPDGLEKLKLAEATLTGPLLEPVRVTIRFPDPNTLIVKSVDGTEHAYSRQ